MFLEGNNAVICGAAEGPEELRPGGDGQSPYHKWFRREPGAFGPTLCPEIPEPGDLAAQAPAPAPAA